MFWPVVDVGAFVVGLLSSVSAVFFEAFNSALAFNSFLIFKSELFILFNAFSLSTGSSSMWFSRAFFSSTTGVKMNARKMQHWQRFMFLLYWFLLWKNHIWKNHLIYSQPSNAMASERCIISDSLYKDYPSSILSFSFHKCTAKFSNFTNSN